MTTNLDPRIPMSELEIYQDHEFDPDFGDNGPRPMFWAKGHGHDIREFIRAILKYCLDNDVDIPAIPCDIEPVETWQQNVEHDGGIEYWRDSIPPSTPRTSRFPITLLDLDRQGRGGTKCSVIYCSEPWSTGPTASVRVEPSDDSEYASVRVWLCREHRNRWPEPSYRVCMIPVGATILLSASEDVVTP